LLAENDAMASRANHPTDRPAQADVRVATQQAGEPVANSRDHVVALARGLQVIHAFGAARPEMTLSEVAAATSLSAATVRRSLMTLEHLGYVRRRERRFVLTPKVLSLGASWLESMNLKELAQPHLVALVERFHDAASLTVLDGLEVVYVAHVPSDQRVRHGRSVGSRLPAHATSTGLVLLAHAPAAQLEALFAAGALPAYTSRTPVTRAAVRALIAQALKEDHAVASETIEYGAIALAVPVRDAQGRVVAALNCATTTRVADEAALLRTRLAPLREAAARIGGMLDRYPALAHSVGPMT
jgi:IclR family pca regulon transcriptional regulator